MEVTRATAVEAMGAAASVEVVAAEEVALTEATAVEKVGERSGAQAGSAAEEKVTRATCSSRQLVSILASSWVTPWVQE